MKKLFIITIIVLLGAISFISCKKDLLIEDNNTTQPNSRISATKDNLQLQFAKVLLSGITDSKELRKLIKTESLKQFDNDYDVLYHLIKDEKIGDVSISQFLSKYAESKEIFANIENQLPLLTIHVPTLPNFDAESWDSVSDIPKLAILESNSNSIFINDINDDFAFFPPDAVPAFPTLVLKMNERVKVSSFGNLKSANINSPSFEFIDPCFNPESNKGNLKTVLEPMYSFDPSLIYAYTTGMKWQRDIVYYGLTQSNVSGAYRPNYCEYLTNFVMCGDWFKKISDQAGDPQSEQASIYDLKSKEMALHNLWTDGSYEFQIRILINSRNGTGSTLTKYFSARVQDLVQVTSWKKEYIGSPLNFNIYIPQEIKSKYYQPNLELLSWDLENYGTTWKFLIAEIDLDQEVSETTEVTSVYATNFGITGTVKKKLGLEFGGTNTQTHKSACTIKTKLESDDLGEAILTFGDPVIIGRLPNPFSSIDDYMVKEITTGWCSFTVVPRKIY